jgi:uncharacterized protein
MANYPILKVKFMKGQSDTRVGSLKPFSIMKNGTKVQTLLVKFKETFASFSEEIITRLILKKDKNFDLKIKKLSNDFLRIKIYFSSDFPTFSIVDESIRAFLILEKKLGLAISIDNYSRVTWKFPILATENVGALNDDIPPLVNACKINNAELVATLIGSCIDINETDLLGNTSLMYAVGSGNLKLIKLLLSSGANIKVVAKEASLLQFAINNDKNIAEFLLKNGAEVDSQNIYGETALFYAVIRKKQDLIRILVENGANPHITNYLGKSPYILAKNAGFKEILDTFENFR